MLIEWIRCRHPAFPKQPKTCLLVVFAALAVLIWFGGEHAQRTPIAMALRSVVWIAIAAIGGWRLRQRHRPEK